MLPDPRAGARGCGRGHLAADRADAGPGRRPGRVGRARRLPELQRQPRRTAARPNGPPWPASWTCSTSPPSGWARSGPGSSWIAARCRCSRSTRRTACPSGVTTSGPTTWGCRSCTSVGRRFPASRSPRRRRRPPEARSSNGWGSRMPVHFVASFDRPNIQYRIEPKEQPLQAAARPDPHRARRRRRHRLLPLARVGREDRSSPAQGGHPRAAVPRGPGVPGAGGQPVPLPARRRHGHGRHHRVRHGHRQARRPLRRPPRPAEERRGLLPGDRPRRARRTAVDGLAGLRAGGRRAAAAHDRRLRGRRPAQAPAGPAPGRDARAVRDGSLPATAVSATSASPAGPAGTATPA